MRFRRSKSRKKSWLPGVGIKMTVWNDLLSVLQTENELLRSLIALGGEKQEKINDADAVMRIAGEEQALLQRLEEVDRERAVLYDVVAPGQDLEDWLPGLDERQQEQAGPLFLELAESVGALRSLNNLNQELLAQSLNYVQFSLNLLVGDESSGTYARQGTTSPRKSIFDRKV